MEINVRSLVNEKNQRLTRTKTEAERTGAEFDTLELFSRMGIIEGKV